MVNCTIIIFIKHILVFTVNKISHIQYTLHPQNVQNVTKTYITCSCLIVQTIIIFTLVQIEKSELVD